MGLRFRKSVKLAPGVKLNIGKKSAGVSVGGKFGGVSINSKTGARARVSAPGTGLSYSSKIGASADTKSQLAPEQGRPSAPGTPSTGGGRSPLHLLAVILRWVFVAFILILALGFLPSVSSLLLLFLAICAMPVRPVIDFLAERLRLSGKIKALAMVILFVASAALYNSGESENLQASAPNALPAAAQDVQESPQEAPDATEEQTPAEQTETPTAPAQEAESAESPSAAEVPAVQAAAPAAAQGNEKTVYVTPTGKRYHYDSTCGNGTYTATTLDKAQARGLTPCKKCAGG